MNGKADVFTHLTQVILGFAISAWLTILILAAYYIFAFDPHADPFPSTNSQNDPERIHIPNPLDVLVTKYMRCFRFRKKFGAGEGGNVFHKVSADVTAQYKLSLTYLKCILSLGDTQLFTGLAILISGYWSLVRGQGLSAYHWKMVLSLAWFSSVTHLSALTFLRSYLAKHPAGRLWRLVLMLIVFILLFVGFFPTGHFEFIGGQIRTAQFIDLGRAMYPKDCGDFQLNTTRYYPRYHRSTHHKYEIILENGANDLRNCIIADALVFQPNNSATFGGTDVISSAGGVRSGTGPWMSEYGQVGVLYEPPAVCFFKGGMQNSTFAYISMVSSQFLLVYSYLIRVTKVYEGPSRFISKYTQKELDQKYEALVKRWARWLKQKKSGCGITIAMMVFLPFQASLYCTLRVFLHLYTSMLTEVRPQ